MYIERTGLSLRSVLQFYEQLWPLDAVAYVHALNKQWMEWQRLSGKPWIGAEVGAQFSPMEHTHAAMILTSRTVQECLQRGFAFYNARNPHTRYRMDTEERHVQVRVVYPPGLEPVRSDAEKRLALLASMVRWLARAAREDIVAHFRGPAPEYQARLPEVFGGPVEFNAETDGLVIDRRVMTAPIWGSEHLAAQLGQLYAASPAPHTAHRAMGVRVAATLRSQLEQGQGGIKSVAAAFGVTPRTLERYLADEGTTFREVLDETRRAISGELVQNADLTIDEISRRLGYSSPANLSRAFRNWFGTTPSRMRRSLHGRG